MNTKLLLSGAALLAVAGMGAAAPAQAKETWGKGAPEFSDPDGNIKFKVRGRVQWDAVSYDQDLGATANDKDGFTSRARRARIGVEGSFDSKFKYKAEFTLLGRNNDTLTVTKNGGGVVTNVTESNGTQVEYEDMFIEYAATPMISVIVGNQDQGYTLERLTSSRFITNMERNMGDQAWGFTRTLGIGVIAAQDNWGVSAFLNGDSPNNTDTSFAKGSQESWEGRLHGYFTPINTPEQLLYVGGTYRYRSAQNGSEFQYRARPETNIGDRLADTGSTATFEEDALYSVEAAAKYKSVYVQGQYDMLNAQNKTGNRDADFTSYFVQGGWYITGESRTYKGGKFDRVTPNNPVSEGGMGAWELRGRYDYLDLDDGAIDGGTMDAWTVGVNWQPVKNVRFMGEYVSASVDDRTAATANGDFDALQFRAQFDF